jgi:hypothetical protein
MSKRKRDLFPIFHGNKKRKPVTLPPLLRAPLVVFELILTMACVSMEDMLNMRLVCLKWSKEIPRNKQCWRYIEYCSTGCSTDLHQIISKVAYFIRSTAYDMYRKGSVPFCRRLSVSCSGEHHMPAMLERNASIFHQLDELITRHSSGSWGETLKSMGSLSKLVLQTSCLGSFMSGMGPAYFPRLTHLTLNAPSQTFIAPSATLTYLARACPRLGAISLKRICIERGADRQALPLPSVKRLTFVYCLLDVDAIASIFTSVETIRVRQCGMDGAFADRLVSKIPSLARLVVERRRLFRVQVGARSGGRLLSVLRAEGPAEAREDAEYETDTDDDVDEDGVEL